MMLAMLKRARGLAVGQTVRSGGSELCSSVHLAVETLEGNRTNLLCCCCLQDRAQHLTLEEQLREFKQ